MLIVLSELYGASVYDRKITLTCGLLAKLDPDDSITARKSFPIGDLLEGKGASLNILPFRHRLFLRGYGFRHLHGRIG